MSLYKKIEKAEREAYRKGMKLYGIFMKLTPEYRKEANKILNKIIEGKINYEEALRELQKLYREQKMKTRHPKLVKPRKPQGSIKRKHRKKH